MTLILPQRGRLNSVSALPATISYVSTASTTSSSSTSHTFNSVSIGAAATGRWILAAISLGSASGLSGNVSLGAIGGVTPTLIAQYDSGGDGVHAFLLAQVDTGTTANFSWTFSLSNDSNRARMYVWNVFDLVDGSAPTDTLQLPDGGDPISGTIDVSAGGVVASISNDGTNTSSTHTWTGLDEDVDASVQSRGFTAASRAFANATTNHTISVDSSNNSTTRMSGFAVALR